MGGAGGVKVMDRPHMVLKCGVGDEIFAGVVGQNQAKKSLTQMFCGVEGVAVAPNPAPSPPLGSVPTRIPTLEEGGRPFRGLTPYS